MANELSWRERAQALLDSKAKPPGSLGTLEEWAVTLCAAQRTLEPVAAPASLIVFAADHGIKAAEPALSPFPQSVTQSIFLAIAAGVSGAAVLARSAGAFVSVVDVGIDSDVPLGSAFVADGCTVRDAKVARGTADFRKTAAISQDQLALAITAGRAAVDAELDERGAKLVLVGIGNTTIAAALLAALTGRDPEECSGKGTGLDDEGVARKVSAVREGLALHAEAVSSRDPMRILGALGGFEIAAMTGAFLQASSRGVVALVDGYMSSVAALFAVRLEPKCRDAMLFTSVSAERGALLVAEALGGVRPALDMGLRLGEGSAAAIALPLAKAAATLIKEMASLGEALALAPPGGTRAV